jgi:NAD(P)-dependent dehydrogenase (short-subunit alcohol dehydrogenase family)
MSVGTQPRIALVTGAARRIGKGIALALAHNGWDVGVHYYHSKAEALATVCEIEQLGRRAAAIHADLASETEARALLPACRALLGLPTCLVNNASLFEYDDPKSFAPSSMQRHEAVNLVAPLLLSRLLHEALLEEWETEKRLQGAESPLVTGVVINLLDQKLINPNPDFFSYTLTKAALLAAIPLLAFSYAPVLRVVGLAPGITLPSGGQTIEQFEQAQAHTPLHYSSRVQDLAEAAVFLACSRAITGTTVYVDGGQHLQPTTRDIMFLT